MVIEFRDLRPMPIRKETDIAFFHCPYIPLSYYNGVVDELTATLTLHNYTQIDFKTRYDPN